MKWIDDKTLQDEFDEVAAVMSPATSREDLLAQRIVCRRLGLLTALTYRGRQYPTELAQSIPSDVLKEALVLAERETPACEKSFSDPINQWLTKLPKSKRWVFLIPEAVNCVHGLPPDGIHDGWMTSKNDTYIPETSDYNYRHPIDHLSRSDKTELMLKGNMLSVDIADALSRLHGVQAEIISQHVLGANRTISPGLLADAVEFVMQAEADITAPRVMVSEWLPHAVGLVLEEAIEKDIVTDKNSIKAISNGPGYIQ